MFRWRCRLRSSIAKLLAGQSLLLAWLIASTSLQADDGDQLPVGRLPDGRIIVPTNQVLQPAGRQVEFPGRPVDLALVEDGKTLVVKNMNSLEFIDSATAQVKQTLGLTPRDDKPQIMTEKSILGKPIADTGKPGRATPTGFSVVGLLAQGESVWVTDSKHYVLEARRRPNGIYEWSSGIQLSPPAVGGPANPAGIARQSDHQLWVTATRCNCVQLLDVSTRQVQQVVPVGVAPYMVCVAAADRCYVSNWGGEPPAPQQPQALSSGTPVRIDAHTGIASSGTVSVIAPVGGKWQTVRSIPVGLHPAGMTLSPNRRFLYVANANSDTISVIDIRREEVVETISCRIEGRLPFGSGTNALTLSPDGSTLYAANGTNNCIAVIRLGSKAMEQDSGKDIQPGSRLAGLIPTAWYPGAVIASPDGGHLYVANIKGIGALSQPRPIALGKNTHDFLGSVSIIPVPSDAQLTRYTEIVKANNRLALSLAGLDRPANGVRPLPVPLRHGEPSVFQHVVYIIKENRSYDQILGDMKEGNGDPKLVIFGEEVTPNQHALARRFTLFDNFYCSGTLSATGHQWTDEAYVTDYLTKTFGDFVRSYPVDGSDPLCFAASGFLWDNALSRGRTFQNFGEFTRTTFVPEKATWNDVYSDYKNGTRNVKFDVKPNVAALAPYTHPGYPSFPLITPDVYRSQLFIEELKRWEQQGSFPNLVILVLPADHSVGTLPRFPTPRAMVADNDLALGRIVEAISRSRFWARTCIFVVEDDPQFGFDHVDGHRTIAQVISPYTRRGFVDHTNYNQTGMVKTIELILGLPPMNQLDLSATPMRRCFQEKPDPSPFTCLTNKIPLDEMNKPLSQLQGKALYWAKKSQEMNFDKEDEADEDTLNHIIWHACRGYDTPYPFER
jgi:YVTN family beta-propeller protein